MKKVALLALALLLTGCTPEPNQVGDSMYGTALVEEHTLSDGTRCAVIVGSYKGGITCDWR